MKLTLFQLIPKKLLSRFAGLLAETQFPPKLLHSFILAYCKYYKVNQDEMIKKIENFSSFNEFFTREIDLQQRPIDSNIKIVISPVDGIVGQHGQINNINAIQAKGIHYSIKDLLGKVKYEQFIDGYFLTLYLSPAHYHRIHTPFDGIVNSISYFSGNLWPVNEFGVQNIGGVFSSNERLVTYLDTEEYGSIAIAKIAALIVGNTKTHYSNIETNRFKGDCLNIPISPAKTVKKGEEIGYFKLGSTVILIFEKNRFTLSSQIKENSNLLFGQKIGSLN